MIFAERGRPSGRLRSAKIVDAKTPHRNGAVIAQRPQRSAGAAKRLDGDGPMWTPAIARCVNGAGPWAALPST
jgi:hypothetical protein